jgi:sulfur-carrier protein
MLAHMITVEFAPALQRHVACAPQQVQPGSLKHVLLSALEAAPPLHHYVLDDQLQIRKHVAVFVNSTMHVQRHDLSRSLQSGDKVLVIQCLTGG